MPLQIINLNDINIYSFMTYFQVIAFAYNEVLIMIKFKIFGNFVYIWCVYVHVCINIMITKWRLNYKIHNKICSK